MMAPPTICQVDAGVIPDSCWYCLATQIAELSGVTLCRVYRIDGGVNLLHHVKAH